MKVQLLLGSTAAILVNGRSLDVSGEEPSRKRLQDQIIARGNNGSSDERRDSRDLRAVVVEKTALGGARKVNLSMNDTKVETTDTSMNNIKEMATTSSSGGRKRKDGKDKTRTNTKSGKTGRDGSKGSKTGSAPSGSSPDSKSSKTGGSGGSPSPDSKSSKTGGSGGSPSPDSKSSKTDSKSGKAGASGDAYYIGPISCPDHCVDIAGVNFVTGILNNVIKPCSNTSTDQKWRVHNDDTFVKLESLSYPNMCIQVKNKSTCVGGTLALGDCSDHESLWYFTGGQLISAYCWVEGFTNVMGVNTIGSGKCDAALNAYGGADSQVIRADIFAFIAERMIADDGGAEMPTEMPTFYVSYFPTVPPTFSPSYVPTASGSGVPTLESGMPTLETNTS